MANPGAPITVQHDDFKDGVFTGTNVVWQGFYRALFGSTGVVQISGGGTSATTAAGARTNLGLTAATQPGFTNVIYLGGWSDYIAANNFPTGYMQSNIGLCFLRGAAQGGAAGQVVFDLPSSMWPLKSMFWEVPANGALGIVEIDHIGRVLFDIGTAPVAFDGITWWPGI